MGALPAENASSETEPKPADSPNAISINFRIYVSFVLWRRSFWWFVEDGAAFFCLNSGTRDGVRAGPCGGDGFDSLGTFGGRRKCYSIWCDLGFLLLCGVFVLGPKAFSGLCFACFKGPFFTLFIVCIWALLV